MSPPGAASTLIRCVRIFDGVRVSDADSVTIRHGRIVAIGTSLDESAATVVDGAW